MRRLRLAGAWLLVLMVTTALAWQIVIAADAQVSDRPLPLNVNAPVLQAGETSEPSTIVTEPTSTTTTLDHSSTSPVTQPTVTAAATPTTTSTSTSAAWQTRVIPTQGGTLVVAYRPGEVYYQTATPKPGYHAEVEQPGPPKVEIKFESQSHEIAIHVEWKNGDLAVEISGSGGD